MKRIYSIDFARGLVMIIMALDHVRDLLHVDSLTGSPTNLATTTPILFFTRWITYLCAPTFVFLAGTSVWLSLKNKGDVAQVRKFLLARGFWLILLEFTVVNFGLYFDPGFHNLLFEVIAAIGFGFIVLALLLKAPVKTIALIGLLILFCHDLFPLVPFGKGSVLQAVLQPLFGLTAYTLSSDAVLVIAYPPVPWLGVMLVGFATGGLFESTGPVRRKVFLKIGVAAIAGFLLLRYLNVYGDPAHWALQKDFVYSFLSFMNISKYPPSLLFCLITLGILFLILAIAERGNNRFTAIVSVYGKAPLFYFIVHFYLIHTLLIVILFMQGFHWIDLNFASGTFGRPRGVVSGLPLWAVYCVWIAVVAVLYKPCLWFGRFKATRENWWLKYL